MTDRRTPRRWQRRAKHSAFARKKCTHHQYLKFNVAETVNNLFLSHQAKPGLMAGMCQPWLEVFFIIAVMHSAAHLSVIVSELRVNRIVAVPQ